MRRIFKIQMLVRPDEIVLSNAHHLEGHEKPHTVIIKNEKEWLARKGAMEKVWRSGYLVTRFLKISRAGISD